MHCSGEQIVYSTYVLYRICSSLPAALWLPCLLLSVTAEKREKFDHGEDPLDPEEQQARGNPFGGGFNPFGGGFGGQGQGFQFKFHFGWPSHLLSSICLYLGRRVLLILQCIGKLCLSLHGLFKWEILLSDIQTHTHTHHMRTHTHNTHANTHTHHMCTHTPHTTCTPHTPHAHHTHTPHAHRTPHTHTLNLQLLGTYTCMFIKQFAAKLLLPLGPDWNFTLYII